MQQIRYAYIKNGDVITQLERLDKTTDSKTTSGPDAFLNDLLSTIGSSPILLLGHGTRNAKYHHRNIIAKVFSERFQVVGKAPARALALFRVFLNLLIFRPNRIVCGRTGGILWICTIISWLYQAPLVHSRHNQVIFEKLPWYRRFALSIDRWCIRHALGVVCHGPYLKKQLLDINVLPSKVYEFDLDFSDMLENVEPRSQNVTELFNPSTVLFLGRVQENKGIYDLLNAMTKPLHSSNSLKLVYAGDGPDLENLRRDIKLRNLSEKVTCLGAVAHKDIARLMSRSKVVVAPTRPEFPEGRCMVVMEAQIAGVPVIAPDFGPFPFLIEHQVNGLLFKPGSLDDLSYQLHRMLDDERLYKTLKSGAEARGVKLRRPEYTFSEAVLRTFSLLPEQR